VAEQVAALPAEALVSCAEVLAVLEVAPEKGAPHHKDNPDGLRAWRYGPRMAGNLVYLILEHQREVHLLVLQWYGCGIEGSGG
jgi:hypothetical protein